MFEGLNVLGVGLFSLIEGQQQPFVTITLGNILSATIPIAGILLAYTRIARERRNDEIVQIERHAKNSASLEMLIGFHSAQTLLNSKRDEQVSELKQQTSMLKEIATGLNRRLEMLEDRRKHDRSHE